MNFAPSFAVINMQNSYQTDLWKLTVSAPWQLRQVDQCIEITQPEGMGAIHISAARKQKGLVSDDDLRNSAAKELPEGEELSEAFFGEFTGFSTSYTDWHTDTFWKKWWLGNRDVMLYLTYNCNRGDEELELPYAEKLLTHLEPRRTLL